MIVSTEYVAVEKFINNFGWSEYTERCSVIAYTVITMSAFSEVFS